MVSNSEQGMSFKVLRTTGRARHGLLSLPHSDVKTPVFMPVGTQGTMKVGAKLMEKLETSCFAKILFDVGSLVVCMLKILWNHGRLLRNSGVSNSDALSSGRL